MRTISIKQLAILVFCFTLGKLQAQEAFLASGGNASGSGGTVSYSVGQVLTSVGLGTNISIAEGVQQPYEISIITEIKEFEDITLKCNAFPNPVSDQLFLMIENYNDDFFYSLFDITGKLLSSKTVIDTKTTIPVEILRPGVYFLRVSKKNPDALTEIKSFKIIKK